MFLEKLKLLTVCISLFLTGLLIKHTEKTIRKSATSGNLTGRKIVRSALKYEKFQKYFQRMEKSALKLFLTLSKN